MVVNKIQILLHISEKYPIDTHIMVVAVEGYLFEGYFFPFFDDGEVFGGDSEHRCYLFVVEFFLTILLGMEEFESGQNLIEVYHSITFIVRIIEW